MRSIQRFVGVFCLMAIGLHAAADLLDDRVLAFLAWLDVLFDGLFARFSVTESWVDAVGTGARLKASRMLVLAWELVADLLLAAPLAFGALSSAAGQEPSLVGGRGGLQRVATLVVMGTVCIFSVAGSLSVANLVEGVLVVHSPVGWSWARGLGLAVVVGVVVSVGRWALEGAARWRGRLQRRLVLLTVVVGGPLLVAQLLNLRLLWSLAW